MAVRLLIVDDEEGFRESLAAQLNRSDFEVAFAPDGERAVELVRERDFDVILLDVLMPGLDGIGTLERIKRARPYTEVIFLTGHASIDAAVVGLERGAFDYVMKPADVDDLAEKIDCAAESRRLNEKLS